MSFKKLTKRSLTSEMERNVKQMLRLIEEEADSFAQKAEMYYQKRPELISLVEEFYRGYKSLAERYDHDLQSQTPCYSDNGSEPNSTWPSPSPRKMGRRISSNRAAGFDFFLGSSGCGNANGNHIYYDASHKDGDGSSTLTDSDDESDASSIHSYNSGFFGGGGSGGGGGGGDHGMMNRRILELEMELREVKEKLCMHDDDHGGSSNKRTRMIENGNSEYLRAKINAYEQELTNVNEKLRLSEEEIAKLKIELEGYRSLESANFHDAVESCEAMDLSNESSLGEEPRITKEKLKSSEMQIDSLRFKASKSSETTQQLQDQLNLALKDIAAWKRQFNNEKRESTKHQERFGRLKTSLADKDNEIRDLKTSLSNAEQSIFFEKARLKSEISRLLDAQTHLEEKIKERECHSQSLEEEIRKVQHEKMEMEETLKGEIELLREDIKERKNNIKRLNASLDALKLQVGELKSRAKELEEENERQRVEILEGAEEKREAIRQLCFSLEHYRNGYNKLRQAFIGHKRFPVLAA